MTKREICEELWNIANAVSFERGLVRGEADVHHAIDRATDALDYVRRALRMLLLNIAVPETEEEKPKAGAPKAEEKHPGIIVDPSGKNPPRCLKCNAEALIKRNLFAVGDEWAVCPKCGCAYRIKRGKDEK